MAILRLYQPFDFSRNYDDPTYQIISATSVRIEVYSPANDFSMVIMGSFDIEAEEGSINNVSFFKDGVKLFEFTGTPWDLDDFDFHFNNGTTDFFNYMFSEDDTITGSSGNDVLIGRDFHDSIDGGAGIDTVAYAYTRWDAARIVEHNSDGSVTIRGNEWSDTLRNIEYLRFTDVTISIESLSLPDNGDTQNAPPALAVPPAPTFTDTSADDTFANATGTLSGSDVDPNTTLTYGIGGGTDAGTTVSKTGTYGTLTVTKATGAYVFAPNDAAIEALNTNASETFTVSVSDGQASASQIYTVNLVGASESGGAIPNDGANLTTTDWRYSRATMDGAGSDNSGYSTQNWGTFAEAWSVSTASTGAVLGAANVTGDNGRELIVADGSTLRYFTSSGQQLGSTANLSFTAWQMTLEDINGDGDYEALVGSANAATTRIGIYDGNGSLIKTINGPNSGSYGDGFMQPAAYLGNGRLAVTLSAGYALDPRGFAVYDINTATNGTQQWFFDAGPWIGTPSVADVDGDGRMEIAASVFTPHNGATGSGFGNTGEGSNDWTLSTFLIDTNGTAQLVTALGADTSGGAKGGNTTILTDLEGDGTHEIVATVGHYSPYYPGDVQIRILNLDGSVRHSVSLGTNNNSEIVVSDLDGDGDKEIVALSYSNAPSPGVARIFDADLNLVTSRTATGATTLHVAADIDGDGTKEIIASGSDGIHILNGRTLADKYPTISLQGVSSFSRVITNDLDGDNRAEIIAVGSDNRVHVIEGQPVLNTPPALAVPPAPTFTDTSADDTFANVIGTLAGSDGDGDTLTYGIGGGTDVGTTVSKTGTYGTLTVTKATGAYVFAPNDAAIEALNTNASETFTVSVSDGQASASQPFTVNIVGASESGPGATSNEAIVYYAETNGNADIYIANADGSNPRQLTTDSAAEYWPQISPDGTRIAFLKFDSSGHGDLYVMNMDGSNQTRVTYRAGLSDMTENSVNHFSWHPNGQALVYEAGYSTTEQKIHKINIDGTGDMLLFNNPDDKDCQPVINPANPNELYFFFDTGNWTPNRVLRKVDITTGVQTTILASDGGTIGDLAFSPDGSKMVLAKSDNSWTGPYHIYLMNPDGTGMTRLTATGSYNLAPRFSPDGTKIIFASDFEGGLRQIYSMNLDGSQVQRLTDTDDYKNTPFWGIISDDGANGPIDDDPAGDEPGDDKPGDDPTGDDPTGDDPTGDDPEDDKPGDDPTGDDPEDDKPGDDPTGDDPTGDDPEDDKPGDDPTGDDPTDDDPDLPAGTPGDDRFIANPDDDSFDGLAGIDTVVFGDNRANYSLDFTASGQTVRDEAGAGGTDTLTNIERLQFADTRIALDLLPTQNAGQSLEFIGAIAFSAIDRPDVVGAILAFFDQGHTLTSLSQLAIDVGLIRDLAGSDSNADLARLVFRNIIGQEADSQTVDALVGYLDGRSASLSQAEFIAALAAWEGNQQHIDLVGLQQTGVEFM